MRKRTAWLGLLGAGLTLVLAVVAAAAIAPIKNYAVGIADGYETKRLLSVGDRVPETSNPTMEYQMIGIPDGLGAHANPTRHDDPLHEPRAHMARRCPSRTSAVR